MANLPYDLFEVIAVNRFYDLSRWACALAYAEPQRALDYGSGPRDHEVVNLWPSLATYLDHVLKAFGCYEGRPGAFALKQCVSCHGRAVNNFGRGKVGLCQYSPDACENRFGWIVWS